MKKEQNASREETENRNEQVKLSDEELLQVTGGVEHNIEPTTVRCMSCGAALLTTSAKEEMAVLLCAKCQPFFTGKRKEKPDEKSRMGRFRERYGRK